MVLLVLKIAGSLAIYTVHPGDVNPLASVLAQVLDVLIPVRTRVTHVVGVLVAQLVVQMDVLGVMLVHLCVHLDVNIHHVAPIATGIVKGKYTTIV